MLLIFKTKMMTSAHSTPLTAAPQNVVPGVSRGSAAPQEQHSGGGGGLQWEGRINGRHNFLLIKLKCPQVFGIK